MNQFLEKAQELEPLLIDFRRKIHSHPETGFELSHTKSTIEKELDQAGIHWEEFAGSLVAVIENGPGKTYMIRAEMDALPMDEESGLSFSSKIPGKAHCCGHDLNASMLLGALILLYEDVSLVFSRLQKKQGRGPRDLWTKAFWKNMESIQGCECMSTQKPLWDVSGMEKARCLLPILLLM